MVCFCMSVAVEWLDTKGHDYMYDWIVFVWGSLRFIESNLMVLEILSLYYGDHFLPRFPAFIYE